MTEPIHILYIDDTPLYRDLVRFVLEKDPGGFVVTEAAYHQDFEAQPVDGKYDLVLSSINGSGPQESQLQALDAIKSKYPHIPLILVIETGWEDAAIEALKRGAFDCVIKTPQYIQRLPHTIRIAIEKQRLQQDCRQAEQETEQRDREITSLLELSRQLTGQLDMDQLLPWGGQLNCRHTGSSRSCYVMAPR